MTFNQVAGEQLHELMKRRRLDLRMAQVSAIRAFGAKGLQKVGSSQYCNWETGKHIPRDQDRVVDIAIVLDLPLEWVADAWAMSQKEKVRKPRPDRPRPACGTVNGYAYHQRHGERVCRRCRKAARDRARMDRNGTTALLSDGERSLRSHTAKMTPELVRYLRFEHGKGRSAADLHRELQSSGFKISYDPVYKAVTGKNWKGV